MFARRLFLSVFAVTFLSLSACDITSSEGIAGVWVGTASFSADTLMADYNVRFQADYDATFTFRINDDDGLITGTVEARFDGQRTSEEAGHDPVTTVFDPSVAFADEFFGTYIDPVLEMDVPDGPYEENLWTFDVRGNNAELNRFLTHIHTITLADSSEFSFPINSEELFGMEFEGVE